MGTSAAHTAMSAHPPVIAVDGVSGSGKSTLAKKVADHFGFIYLNTGDIYRGLTALLFVTGTPIEHAAALLANATIETPDGRVLINEQDVTDLLHSPHVETLVAQVSPIPEIRANVERFQRYIVSTSSGVVLEGRNIAELFPHALHKILITASPRTRAERRYARNTEEFGSSPSVDMLEIQLKERDERDMNRQHGRLMLTKDAILIDTSGKTVEESFKEILSYL